MPTPLVAVGHLVVVLDADHEASARVLDREAHRADAAGATRVCPS